MLYNPYYFLLGLYKKVFYFNDVAKWQTAGGQSAAPKSPTKLSWLLGSLITVPLLLWFLALSARSSTQAVALDVNVLSTQLLFWIASGLILSLVFLGYFSRVLARFYIEMCVIGKDMPLPKRQAV